MRGRDPFPAEFFVFLEEKRVMSADVNKRQRSKSKFIFHSLFLSSFSLFFSLSLLLPPNQNSSTSFPIRKAVFPSNTPGEHTLTAPSSISTPRSFAFFSSFSHFLAAQSLGKWRKKT